MTSDRARRLTGELVGTALLLATVVGSGIMGEQLAGGNVAIVLLANSIATGAVLAALIAALGPVSGAHFNPAVTISDALLGGTRWRDVPGMIAAQLAGAVAGVAAAHAMFALPMTASTHARSGLSQLVAEAIATFGLLLVIIACARRRPAAVAPSVGAYIAGAYWFTASTSFANPAVTIARAMTDTFAGIRPADVPGFVTVQLVAAIGATFLLRWLVPAVNVARQP